MQYLKAVEWITLNISYINVVGFANEWWPFVLIWLNSGIEVKTNFDQENVRQSPPTQAVGNVFPICSYSYSSSHQFNYSMGISQYTQFYSVYFYPRIFNLKKEKEE